MRLTERETLEFNLILRDYFYDDNVQKMKGYYQHGRVSTFDHVVNVAKVCFYLNRRWNLRLKEKDLVIGAFLHDFYLYDWHSKDNNTHRLHGFRHPFFAARNAVKYFHVGPRVADIILTHMWPLTILSFPKTREAFLVSMVDKYCSVHESLLQRRKLFSICK